MIMHSLDTLTDVTFLPQMSGIQQTTCLQIKALQPSAE